MIDAITVENFKSYRKATLPLASLTLLIGANASGKSNVLEALHFLARLARGRRLDDILDGVRQEGNDIRGGVAGLLYDGANGKNLGFGCTLAAPAEWPEFYIELGLTLRGAKTEMQVVAEHLRNSHSTVPLYQVIHGANSEFRHEAWVAYDNFAPGGRKPQIPCDDRLAIFTQLEVPSRFNNKKSQQAMARGVSRLQQTFQDIVFLDPNPRAMVGYSHVTETELKTDGAGLSGILYNLCVAQGRAQEVLDFIQALPEQTIAAIDFVMTSREEVMVRLAETFGGRQTWRDAPQLSDGTLRVLAIAAALLSTPKGGLVVIEEIDNGIHPSRSRQLLENILRVAQANDLRVLLTSHNPALLDGLPPEAIPDVVCCYRDPKGGDSRLIRLADLTDYPELVAQGPVGQLMTKGILDHYLKHQRTAAQKAKAQQTWWQSWQQELAKDAQVQAD